MVTQADKFGSKRHFDTLRALPTELVVELAKLESAPDDVAQQRIDGLSFGERSALAARDVVRCANYPTILPSGFTGVCIAAGATVRAVGPRHQAISSFLNDDI